MTLADHLAQVPNGAHFHRLDLHIHSHGQSPDVNDIQMTPENIVRAAEDLGLAIIAITDHNRIGNVELALQASSELDLVVIPGIELSTFQGHVLAYFSSLESLNRFYYSLKFDDSYESCRHTIAQCCDAAAANEGFCIAAHVDKPGGFEIETLGYGDSKKSIVKNEALVALEIADLASRDWFSNNDKSDNRRGLLALRREELLRAESYRWPVVMFSDAHALSELQSASHIGRVTRAKMETASFESLKIALADPTSRIRIEETVPKRVPRFVGIRTSGGFLGEQAIRFSDNLTCIIGGRGTGKSTLLESLRVAAGYSSESKLVDSEVWPDLIELLYEDETGAQHVHSRRKLGSQKDPTTGAKPSGSAIQIESYGQGETAARIQNCQADPSILLAFLDAFTGVEQLTEQDEQYCEGLRRNLEKLQQAEQQLTALPTVIAKLNELQAKMEALKKQDIGELVRLEEELTGGKSFRKQIIDRLNDLFRTISKSLGDREPFDIVMALEPKTEAIGATQLESIKGIIAEVRTQLDATKEHWDNTSDNHIAALRKVLSDWAETEAELESKIEARRKALVAQGIQPDLQSIRRITEEHSATRARLEELKAIVHTE